VSFATAVTSPAALFLQAYGGPATSLYLHIMATLDRHLFNAKAARRRSGQTASFITTVNLAAAECGAVAP
jgi:hypothetical protein